jgi:hypothetical protein
VFIKKLALARHMKESTELWHGPFLSIRLYDTEKAYLKKRKKKAVHKREKEPKRVL